MKKMDKRIQDLDLGRFSRYFNKSDIILNADGTFDYNGNLNFSNIDLKSLEEIPIKFNYVKGNFWCYNNKLINLKGAPLEVGGTFSCTANKLISLKGSSKRVGTSFHCDHNNLISLQYAPKEIGGNFNCSFNYLLSEVHLSKIGGEFDNRNYPYKIPDDIIENVKNMSMEQRRNELKFFKENDQEAYKTMLKILDDYDLPLEEFKMCYTVK